MKICHENLIGRVFDRLTVVEYIGRDIHNNSIWKCRCSCGSGKDVFVTSSALYKGRTRSCGCYRREVLSTSHIKYNDPDTKYLAIRKFGSMKYRCYNPNDPRYKNYGGRGIKICDEWLKNPEEFAKWAKDHGWKPGLTIDRIDNDGPYSPENCRWVDNSVQQNNKRNNRNITIGGETMSLASWAKRIGVTPNSLHIKTDRDAENVILEHLHRND